MNVMLNCRSFFEVAGAARAGGETSSVGAVGAAVTDEPLEAAGAWGDDDDVLGEDNKVPTIQAFKLIRSLGISIELKTGYFYRTFTKANKLGK